MNKFSNFSDHMVHNHSSMLSEDETVSSKLALMEDGMTYKEILHAIDPRDLPYRDYAPLIKFVKYVGTKNNISKFFVPNKYNGWNTYIQFMEWDEQVRDTSLTAMEAAQLLLYSGSCRIECFCPAHAFYGMKYIDTQLGIAIVPETRYPHIRNPNLKGIACKHLIRTIKVLPLNIGFLAKAIKEQRYADYIS